MNRAYWALPGIKGTVWEHYMLVASQWPTIPHPAGPQNDGGYFPGQPLTADAPRENYQAADAPKENLVNTTIETYFQDAPSSCMSCHQSVSNALGPRLRRHARQLSLKAELPLRSRKNQRARLIRLVLRGAEGAS